jgi:hypothetical protein
MTDIGNNSELFENRGPPHANSGILVLVRLQKRVNCFMDLHIEYKVSEGVVLELAVIEHHHATSLQGSPREDGGF